MSGFTHRLPDGSVATVESTGNASSLISRSVDDVTVWGQAFACGSRDGLSAAEAHSEQVAEVLADMAQRPGDFMRWWGPDGGAR